MKLIGLIFLVIPCLSLGQDVAPSGAATTTGPCSLANTGRIGTVTCTCGIGTRQGEEILKVLNTILANQLAPGAVMKKLDEILHAVNPNLPPKTYFCDGQWRTAGPSATAAFDVSIGGDDIAFKEMVQLNNSRQSKDLLTKCLAQRQSAPEGLTPRLLRGLAYLGLGNKDRASAMVKEFDSRTGPAYDTGGCKQMSDYLHSQLR